MKYMDIRKKPETVDKAMKKLLDSTPGIWTYQSPYCEAAKHNYVKLNRRTIFCTRCGIKK